MLNKRAIHKQKTACLPALSRSERSFGDDIEHDC
jgi:hypothetical protein